MYDQLCCMYNRAATLGLLVSNCSLGQTYYKDKVQITTIKLKWPKVAKCSYFRPLPWFPCAPAADLKKRACRLRQKGHKSQQYLKFNKMDN